MDQLPVEIQEKILHHFLWDEIEELYRLRVVSKAWKSVIDEFTSRLFQVWYRRCKIEIPNDHLTDIIQAKYPLVAQPWQKFYWVDSRLPHVAKNAYEIWKSFPNFDEGIDARIEPYGNWPRGLSISDGVTNMNDKYIGRIAKEYGDWVTEISPWNAEDDFSRKYHFKSDQIEFYTTEKGTFVVLVKYVMANHSWEYYISKHPIDRLDLPPELISLGQSDEQYYFTQNECFSTFRDGYPSFIHVEHRTLTERGFETSTIIKPPAEIVQHDDWWGCPRIEICGCTLYVMLKGDEQKSVSIAKYKISRNSKGKLSFTLEEFKVATRDEQGNSALYSQIYSLLEFSPAPTA